MPLIYLQNKILQCNNILLIFISRNIVFGGTQNLIDFTNINRGYAGNVH